jgi:23S rRNA (uracil1939-C5)-methyltransferase
MGPIELRIQDIAFGGKGVGREDGKAVFVPYVIEGEQVCAEIVREKKRFSEAELVEVTESSPERVVPRCPYFGRCGGCAYQHMTYPHQLATKQRQVAGLLQRLGGIEHPPVNPTLPSPAEYGYRNRITVHVQDGTIGFFRRDSHRLIDVEHCPIASEDVNQALQQLRANKPRDGHYTLRAGGAARTFSQTNDEVAELLLGLIDDLLPPNQDLLIDAYSGAGFFARRLRDKFEHVIGIDWDRFAIAEARKNATAKETYIAGDVEVELGKVGAVHRTALASALLATTLIVDPPAAGLTSSTCRVIVDLAPSHFVYVSCNPSTLARDLKGLSKAFCIRMVTPLDMFPQTAEIEVIVLLQKRTGDAV